MLPLRDRLCRELRCPEGNRGPQGPASQALLINIVLLSLFAIHYSVMARLQELGIKIVPKSVERSTYVLISSLLLLLLFWKWQPITGVVYQNEVPTLLPFATSKKKSN